MVLIRAAFLLVTTGVLLCMHRPQQQIYAAHESLERRPARARGRINAAITFGMRFPYGALRVSTDNRVDFASLCGSRASNFLWTYSGIYHATMREIFLRPIKQLIKAKFTGMRNS